MIAAMLNSTDTDRKMVVYVEGKDKLAKGKVGKAVVIGGGFIGIEMAESFADLWGVETSLVEFMPTLLPNILDPIFSAMLANHLRQQGINVYTDEGATSIEADVNGKVCKVTTSARTIETDIVVMAAGVRPRSELASEAGLQISTKGGIIVNEHLQTSDPDIYAAGDCIETIQLLSGNKCHAPMDGRNSPPCGLWRIGRLGLSFSRHSLEGPPF